MLNAVITGSLILVGYALSHWLLRLFITQDSVRLQAEPAATSCCGA
ncbi:MAG: hypothetical protein R3E42_16935 [Burkholderiaceae bacterium]